MAELNSLEKQILAAAMASRGVYETFESIGAKEEFSPIGASVYRAISEYYSLDNDVRSVDVGVLEARLLRAVLNPKHEGAYREFIRDLPRGVSAANIEHDIRALHKAVIGRKLSLALANGAAEQEVSRLLGEYGKAGVASTTNGPSRTRVIDVLDTADLLDTDGMAKDFIKLWPKSLNDRLDGGALRGHHILIYARPETGKTAFAVNMTAGFLHQKLGVLYVANEEPLPDVRDRLRARLLKVTKQDVRRNPGMVAERLGKADLGRIVLTDEASTFRDVRKALDGFNADVVVLDQLRNMRVDAESKHAQLEEAANQARSIGKDYNALVVSITQAGDSASGKVFLDMSDVDSSKTGIPGAMDLMVGIGADDTMRANGLIGLTTPKNKLGGSHDKFTASIDFSTGVID